MNVKLTNRSFDRPIKRDVHRHLSIHGKIAQFESQGLTLGSQAMADALKSAGFTDADIERAQEGLA